MLDTLKNRLASVSLLESVEQPLIALGLLITATTCLAYIVYQRFFAPLANVKGPFLASLTPLWKLHAFNKGNFHETILEVHQKHGSIVRIAPSEVIISDKAAVREIYSTVQGKDYLKVSIPRWTAGVHSGSF
jgi:hypothetical protein